VRNFWILHNEKRRELHRSLSFVAIVESRRVKETISRNEKKIGELCVGVRKKQILCMGGGWNWTVSSGGLLISAALNRMAFVSES
jgi:hypothetical protein